MHPSAVIKRIKSTLKCNSRSTHFPTPDNTVEKLFLVQNKTKKFHVYTCVTCKESTFVQLQK